MEHIVLRASPSQSNSESLNFKANAFLPNSRGSTRLKNISIEESVKTSDRFHYDLGNRSSGILADAPSMPIKLIAPLNLESTAPLSAQQSWGLSFVGADHCSFDGRGIAVAVLDTGIDRSHPAFFGKEIVFRNFTEEGDEDTSGHGTHCAGIIAGGKVNGVRIGVAPGIKKLIIGKVLGKGQSTAGIARAIQWATESGAHIISMSIGIDLVGCVEQFRTRNIPEAVAIGIALDCYRRTMNLFNTLGRHIAAAETEFGGSLLIAASGNESLRNLDASFSVPSSPPSNSEGFISVSAVCKPREGQESPKIASFANCGSRFAAPGEDIISSVPGGYFASMTGTSMAAPHVAGIATLWANKLAWNGKPVTGRIILDALIRSCDSHENLSTELVEAGIPKAPN